VFVGGANSMDKAAERAASVAEVKRLPGVQAYPRAEVARRISASEWSALADMGGEVSGHCQPQSVVSLAHKLGAPGDKVGEAGMGAPQPAKIPARRCSPTWTPTRGSPLSGVKL
jgi:hypothetical protein